MATAMLVMAAFWLAYNNGANDNFKGVATLYGSSTTSFRNALMWATLATGAGSLVSVVFAGKLIEAFSGRGLVPEAWVGTPQLLIAVGAGSAMTIFLATRLGMPTSTTHALTGALLGIAIVASSSKIGWAKFLYGFAGPLLLSPLISLGMAAISTPVLRRMGSASGITRHPGACVCLGNEASAPVCMQGDGSVVLASPGLSVRVDRMENCLERYPGPLIAVDLYPSMHAVHYLSAGAVCFSRAVNDTPKIAALLLATQGGTSPWGLGLLAVGMALGGLLNSRRVAETMSKRITDLSPGQGLSANLVTTLLVLFASQWGLPISTTHVSCGSLFGIGLANRTGRWKTVAAITAAWVTTLPLAAVLSGLLFLWTRQIP